MYILLVETQHKVKEEGDREDLPKPSSLQLEVARMAEFQDISVKEKGF